MATNQAILERVKALVAEVLAEEQAEGRHDQPENMNDIEDAMVRIGDLVAREFGVQKLSQHTSQVPERPPCPTCGCEGRHVGPKARKLITRRGEVPLTETKYRCPKCRRHFFPSERGFGA